MNQFDKERLKNVRKLIDNNRKAFTELVNLKDCFTAKTYGYMFQTLQSEFEIYRKIEGVLLNGFEETTSDNSI